MSQGGKAAGPPCRAVPCRRAGARMASPALYARQGGPGESGFHDDLAVLYEVIIQRGISCQLLLRRASREQSRPGQARAGQGRPDQAGQTRPGRAGQTRPGRAGQGRADQARPGRAGQGRPGQAGRAGQAHTVVPLAWVWVVTQRSTKTELRRCQDR